VQFQKGLSDAQFEALYGTEEKCRAALFAWRWPEGFACPRCGGVRYCVIKQRGLYQCNGCHAQTSLISGTIFASTKLELKVWFRAMSLMTQTKQGISRLELSRRLGVCYDTAWKIHHKLAQVMMERDAGKPLEGRVEMDDACLGGERPGGKRGRGSPGKMPIVAAVETTGDGKPVRLKIRRVKRFDKSRIKTIAKRIFKPGTKVVTDGLGCFRGLADAGCTHEAVVTGSGRKAARHPAFKLVPAKAGMGQHRARQRQECALEHLPRRERKARAARTRRVRVPLQPPLRSCRDDPAPRLDRPQNPANALSALEVG
jgi:hypothetical protein